MRANRSASTASMLTVTRRSPASFSGCTISASRWPLVVMAMSSDSPSRVRSRDNSCTNSSTPWRSSGSPPVMRTLVIPSEVKTRAMRR